MPPPKNNNKSKLKKELVDYNTLKFGLRIPESQNGNPKFMKNPQSSATGLYGQKYSEIENLPEYKNISRDKFAKDTVLQNKVFDDRFNKKLKDIPGLKETGEELYNEYKNSTKYTATQIAAISNLLGRSNTRKYLGYVERDGKNLEEIFPNRYGSKIKVKNKTPDEYLKEAKLYTEPIKKLNQVSKPIKPINKKLEDNDSWFENVVEFVDPTGITSYDDVYRSYKNTGLSGETALEALGALPFIGKIGKSGKVITGGFGLLQDTVKAAQYLPSKQQKQVVDKAFDLYQKYSKSGGKEFDELLGSGTKFIKNNIDVLNPELRKSSDKLINTFNTSFKAGKGYDAYQAATGSKDDSGLKITDKGVQYNGRNIMPDVTNENMYKYGGNIPMKLNKYNYGGYMYSNGGNTLYVNDPNDPRLKAYQDSLSLYNDYNRVKNILDRQYSSSDYIKKEENFPRNPDGSICYNCIKKEAERKKQVGNFISNLYGKVQQLANPNINPKGYINYLKDNLFFDESQGKIYDYSNVNPVQPVIYQQSVIQKPTTKKINKKLVQPVEYQKLDKIPTINKFNVETPNNIIDSIIRPNQEVTTPKVFVDEYTGYNNPNIPKGRIKYGKGKTDEFAYGGNLYPLGGPSILTQSNLKTGEALAKENTVLDKNKEQVSIDKPIVSDETDKKMKTATVSSPVNINIPSIKSKKSIPTSTSSFNLNPIVGGTGSLEKSLNTFKTTPNIQAPAPSDPLITIDTSNAPPPVTSLDQLGQGPELNANTSLNAPKPNKSSGFGVSQAIGAVQGGINSYNAIDAAARLNQGNTTGIPKSQQIDANVNAVDTTINSALSQMGPVGGAVSALRGVGDMIGKPIKEEAEARNPDGTLKDPEKAKTSAIIGSFFDPIKALTTRASYEGGWTDFTGDKYIDAIEGEKKVNYTDPNIVNRSLKLTPESNQARYGGKMFSYGGNIYAGGGMAMYNMPKGLTHEQHPYGGYPIGNNNFVESDEVILDKPDGSKYIFSNRLRYK